MNLIRRWYSENRHNIKRNLMAYGMAIAAVGGSAILFFILGQYFSSVLLAVVMIYAVIVVVGMIAEWFKEKLP